MMDPPGKWLERLLVLQPQLLASMGWRLELEQEADLVAVWEFFAAEGRPWRSTSITHAFGQALQGIKAQAVVRQVGRRRSIRSLG